MLILLTFMLHSGFFSYLAIPLTESKLACVCMICGALLVTVPTAMTVIAGKLAAANVPDIYPAVQRDTQLRVETKNWIYSRPI